MPDQRLVVRPICVLHEGLEYSEYVHRKNWMQYSMTVLQFNAPIALDACVPVTLQSSLEVQAVSGLRGDVANTQSVV